MDSRVNDFLEFLFVLSFYAKRRGEFFDLRRESVVLVRFEEADMEGVVDGH